MAPTDRENLITCSSSLAESSPHAKRSRCKWMQVLASIMSATSPGCRALRSIATMEPGCGFPVSSNRSLRRRQSMSANSSHSPTTRRRVPRACSPPSRVRSPSRRPPILPRPASCAPTQSASSSGASVSSRTSFMSSCSRTTSRRCARISKRGATASGPTGRKPKSRCVAPSAATTRSSRSPRQCTTRKVRRPSLSGGSASAAGRPRAARSTCRSSNSSSRSSSKTMPALPSVRATSRRRSPSSLTSRPRSWAPRNCRANSTRPSRRFSTAARRTPSRHSSLRVGIPSLARPATGSTAQRVISTGPRWRMAKPCLGPRASLS